MDRKSFLLRLFAPVAAVIGFTQVLKQKETDVDILISEWESPLNIECTVDGALISQMISSERVEMQQIKEEWWIKPNVLCLTQTRI